VSAATGHVLPGVSSHRPCAARCLQPQALCCPVSAATGHVLPGVCSHRLCAAWCLQPQAMCCLLSAVTDSLHSCSCLHLLWLLSMLAPASSMIQCAFSQGFHARRLWWCAHACTQAKACTGV